MSTTTPVLQSALTSDGPIFRHQRVSHNPPHPVTHLATSNLQVVLVLANKTVQRINQASRGNADASSSSSSSSSSPAVETVEFGRHAPGGTRVHGAFLDPLGAHLLLSLRPGEPDGVPELIYLNRRSSKFRPAAKVKGNLVTAAAWASKNTSESLTGPVLLATSKGVVYETELDSGEDKMFSSSLEKYWKVVVNLGGGQHMPITGLAYFNVEKTQRYFVLVTTSSRLYQFQGSASHNDRPLLVSLVNSDPSQQSKFLELPGSLRVPQTLFFCYQAKEPGRPHARHPLYPTSFGWMTGPGVYHGKVDPGGSAGDTVTVDCKLLQYPSASLARPAESHETTSVPPKTILLTEFHAVLAYDACVKGICLLNQQVVFSSEFDPAEGAVRGMSKDPISGGFFVFTDYFIHKFKVDREERNVWKIYLESGDFDLAQHFCQGDAEKLDEVLTRRAQDLFDKGLYLESAMHFAKTKCSFEEIALRFMQIDEKGALLNYLKKHLEAVKPSEKTQLTLIVVWLVENYLSRIRKLEEAGESRREEAEAVRREFTNMLQTSKMAECVTHSKGAIYDLLASHGDSNTIVQFATFTGDFDRVVRCHLQGSNHSAALAVLREQRQPELYYQYGPEFMQALPGKFIDVVIEQGRNLLSPTKVLPALVICSRKDQEMQAIRYLEFTINVLRRKDPALHNFLISLYVKHQPEKIEDYLVAQGYSIDDIPYDIEYTLRLLTENNQKRECLVLYCILGQLEEAVGIALEVDLSLAERCLEFAADDEMRRKIWMRIAQHVVQQENDIRRAMEYLKKSGDLVKIEDILPFFPDFVTIDHFKEAICDSLQEYSDHIEELRREMEESNRSADTIRAEIQEYKNSHVFVRAVDSCSVCSGFLMSKPFYLFNCGHRMHSSCLEEEVRPYLRQARQHRLDNALAELAAIEAAANDARGQGGGGGRATEAASVGSNGGKGGVQTSRKEALRAEVDEIVAHECFFCGDIMIKMVDRLLIDEDQWEESLKEWL